MVKEVLAVASKRKSPTLQHVGGLCVQGDVLAAYHYLQHKPVKTKREEALARRLFDRFLVEEPKYRINSRDAWVRNVTKVYYRYYTSVLTKQASTSQGEELLLGELSKFVLGRDLETVEANLKEEFAVRGYNFLGGITEPFWGPYIWKTQEETIFDIEIPSGTEQLTVYFMKDFLMLSWLEFASLGLAATGGWATDGGLYCVYERYKSILDEPGFTISYLKHEAQHVADFRMFPTLQAKDLEYRAKLVELIYYPTKDKLFDFLTQAGTDVENAHAYSAYVIVSRLSRIILHSEVELERNKWDGVSVEDIHETSTQLMNEHTDELLCGSTGI